MFIFHLQIAKELDHKKENDDEERGNFQSYCISQHL